MPVRSAEAVWEGSNTEGKGKVKFGNPAYEGVYTRAGRFEEAPGTNPEEILGAAHAACFSMALAGNLTRANFPPERIHTTAQVSLEKLAEGFKITKITLNTEVKAPGLDEATLMDLAGKAKSGCPVSVALAGVDEIVLNAKLV